MVRETLGPGWSITAWRRSDESDRRIYFDGPAGAKITYYVADSRHPPGTLTVEGLGRAQNRQRIAAVARAVAAQWRSHRRFSADAAADAIVPADPYPADYLAIRDQERTP